MVDERSPDRDDDVGGVRAARSIRALDHATTWLERPVRRVVGSHRLNPLPHAGTISVFLLVVVVVSGLYITLFYEFGYEASYRSVSAMEDHAIQRIVRALHRYASAALVVTTMVHAWRIFVAARFTGRPRRWRGATGMASLLLVWLAGVTGYWLVWDVRAQALSEATVALVGRWRWGTVLAVDHLLATGDRSGSATLLALWFAHLGLTAAIGWFAFRHLRRTRLAWWPPRHWMALMGGTLLVASLALPLGMAPAADPTALTPPMSLDPFVLFLLPPLLSPLPWLWLGLGAVAAAGVGAVPWILRRGDRPVIVIDDEACTGCELCAIDCPYQALTMVERVRGRSLAVVEPAGCVSCGVCLGACAFDAITLPGSIPVPTPGAAAPGPGAADVEGRRMIVVCDRHNPSTLEPTTDDGAGPVVAPVRCAGMLAPSAVAHFYEAGATGVQLVGCAPDDCRYGIGNRRAAERLAGERAPQLSRRWSGLVAEDWVSPGELGPALADPGRHPAVSGSSVAFRREAYLGAGLVVALSVLAVAAATRAPFRADGDGAAIRLVIDHHAGRALTVDPEHSLGPIDGVTVRSGGATVGQRNLDVGDGTSLAVLDLALTVAPDDLEIVVSSGGDDRVVVDALSPPAAGHRLVVELVDVAEPVDAADGERIFGSRAVGCAVCHSVERGEDGVGPSLYGVASVAGDRVEGLTPELYLRQSILLPDQYVLDGWPAGQMLPFYRDDLSENDLDALVAYLLTLEDTDDDPGDGS